MGTWTKDAPLSDICTDLAAYSDAFAAHKTRGKEWGDMDPYQTAGPARCSASPHCLHHVLPTRVEPLLQDGEQWNSSEIGESLQPERSTGNRSRVRYIAPRYPQYVYTGVHTL